MLSSSAQFTAVAAPHDPRLHPVGSAWPAMPVRQADADDADDVPHHGNHGGVSWCTKQHEPVTILKPMCRINMTPEGDPQVALAASQPLTSEREGVSGKGPGVDGHACGHCAASALQS